MATRALTVPSSTITGVLARRGLVAQERDLAQALERALGRYLSAPGALRCRRSSVQSCAPAVSTLTPTVPTPQPRPVRLPTMRRWSRPRSASPRLLPGWASTAPACATASPPASSGRCRSGSAPAAAGAAVRAAGGLLPGLPEVLRALPDDLHPLEVSGFLTGRRPELRLRGRDQSPVEWLVRGGDVAEVVAAAEGVRDRLL